MQLSRCIYFRSLTDQQWHFLAISSELFIPVRANKRLGSTFVVSGLRERVSVPVREGAQYMALNMAS